MPKYSIAITENTLELIQYLNSGGPVLIEEKPTFFVFEILSPTEIEADIVFEEEVHGKELRRMLVFP
jgi:hypothetical protein